MKVIDLYSGLGGWGAAFLDRGHDVLSIDIEPSFNPDIVSDIRDLFREDITDSGEWENPAVILASPPCNCFSVASIRYYWENGKPKNEKVRSYIRLTYQTIGLIYSLRPTYWVLENPGGMMRRILGQPQQVTYFASWAEPGKLSIKKPTDLWGNLPRMDWPEPKDWIKAPRGSKLGVQGIKGAAIRAKIPYRLSEAMCLAIEGNV